jgi:hypothetical protein
MILMMSHDGSVLAHIICRLARQCAITAHHDDHENLRSNFYFDRCMLRSLYRLRNQGSRRFLIN